MYSNASYTDDYAMTNITKLCRITNFICYECKSDSEPYEHLFVYLHREELRLIESNSESEK